MYLSVFCTTVRGGDAALPRLLCDFLLLRWCSWESRSGWTMSYVGRSVSRRECWLCQHTVPMSSQLHFTQHSTLLYDTPSIAAVFTAPRCLLAVAVCPSVRPSVCYTPVLCKTDKHIGSRKQRPKMAR